MGGDGGGGGGEATLDLVEYLIEPTESAESIDCDDLEEGLVGHNSLVTRVHRLTR